MIPVFKLEENEPNTTDTWSMDTDHIEAWSKEGVINLGCGRTHRTLTFDEACALLEWLERAVGDAALWEMSRIAHETGEA